MKTIVIMIFLSVFVFACSGEPVESNYLDGPGSGTEDFITRYSTISVILPGRFPDVNKTYQTTNMCWAIAVANMLEYTGWADDAVDVMDIFINQYGNIPMSGVTAMDWYFVNHTSERSRFAYTVIESDKSSIPYFTASSIENGKPVLFQMLKEGGFGHIVVVYGYRYIPWEYEEAFVFSIVDGDDPGHTQYLTVGRNRNSGNWDITSGILSNYDLGHAMNLSPKF